jgi:hypothetical protein
MAPVAKYAVNDRAGVALPVSVDQVAGPSAEM